MKIFYAVILWILASGTAISQVIIYPTIAFIDPVSRSSYVKLVNNSENSMEVSITANFSYKNTDSVYRAVTHQDSVMETKHSLLKYLKIFPQRLIVSAKKEQTVRFLVMHPPDLPDGTYTATLTIYSQPVNKQVIDTSDKNVHMTMIMRTGMVTMVIYQKGKVNTALELKDLSTSMDTSGLNINMDMEKTGNSPYWGKARISLFDMSGAFVDSLAEPFGVYCSTTKIFSFRRAKNYKPGTYKAEITIDTQRGDIPPDKIIKVPAIKKELVFKLP